MGSIALLPKALRHGALVLTVPQSKGLEFDDVFIVNFFKDSPASSEWRILMEYLEEIQDMTGVNLENMHVCLLFHFHELEK